MLIQGTLEGWRLKQEQAGSATGKLVWSSVLECRAWQRNNLARSGSRAAKRCVVGANCLESGSGVVMPSRNNERFGVGLIANHDS